MTSGIARSAHEDDAAKEGLLGPAPLDLQALTHENGPAERDAAADDSADFDDDDYEDDEDFAADDRRAMFEPPVPIIGRVARLMPFAIVALALHLGIFAALALFARTVEPIPAQSETAVEIVQEMPKAQAEKIPEPVKTEPTKADVAKLDDVKIAKPEPLKPEPPKVEAPKIEIPKAEAPKTEAPKVEAPKAEAPKAERKPKADVQAPEPPKAPVPSEADPETAKALETMRTELAALQEQKQTLQHEAEEATAKQNQAEDAARAKAAVDAKAAIEAKALGLDLPDAFMAVAMPGQSVDGEVGASYQSLVFSLLAKARKTVKQVVRPGVAGVAFTIDDAGKLASLTLEHPSGDKGLDDEALAIVRRAGPFPRPLPGGQRTFSAAMRFYIDD